MDLREYNFSVIQCLCNSKVDVMNFLQLAGTGIRDEISRNIHVLLSNFICQACRYERCNAMMAGAAKSELCSS